MICDKRADFLPDIQEIKKLQEGVCPIDWALRIADSARRESCGKCVMCREGLLQIYTIISDITNDLGENDDIELLIDLCEVINEAGSCEVSRRSSELILTSLKEQTEEWNLHLKRKRCTAGVCKKFTTFVILPDKCQASGVCVESCTENAILGGEGEIHVIDKEKCSKCGDCLSVCTNGAIIKSGTVVPKTPEAPVPVGSFGGGAEGGRRRRRRG